MNIHQSPIISHKYTNKYTIYNIQYTVILYIHIYIMCYYRLRYLFVGICWEDDRGPSTSIDCDQSSAARGTQHPAGKSACVGGSHRYIPIIQEYHWCNWIHDEFWWVFCIRSQLEWNTCFIVIIRIMLFFVFISVLWFTVIVRFFSSFSSWSSQPTPQPQNPHKLNKRTIQ